MDETPETEEGKVRGGRKLSEEARANSLVLLSWSANVKHLPCGAIADIARKSLCSPDSVWKIWMRLLDGKKSFDIFKYKIWAMPMQYAMTRMILLKNLFSSYC